MAQFTRTIPDTEVWIFLNALHWAHTSNIYSDTILDDEWLEVTNPISLVDASGNAIDKHFQMIIKKYQEKVLRDEAEASIQASIVDVEIV